MNRTGRRRGSPGTREAILGVARGRFAERGYDATSLRAIAAEAEVDPALVIHYFGSKEGLFTAATGMPGTILEVFQGGEGLGARDRLETLVRGYLALVDEEASRNAIIALVRSATSNDQAAIMLREFMSAQLLPVIAGLTDEPDARLRASLIAAQLIGIAMLRHVVKVEYLVQATPDEIVALVTPVIAGYMECLPLSGDDEAEVFEDQHGRAADVVVQRGGDRAVGPVGGQFVGAEDEQFDGAAVGQPDRRRVERPPAAGIVVAAPQELHHDGADRLVRRPGQDDHLRQRRTGGLVLVAADRREQGVLDHRRQLGLHQVVQDPAGDPGVLPEQGSGCVVPIGGHATQVTPSVRSMQPYQ